MTQLGVCLQQLISVCSSPSDSNPHKVPLSRYLKILSLKLKSLLRRPSLIVHLKWRSFFSHALFPPLNLHLIPWVLSSPNSTSHIFNSNILNWKTFWEQFKVSIHDRANISDTEKLVYLQHALREGTAKCVIESLSRSGEHYAEAVECLQARYDRPRLDPCAHDSRGTCSQGRLGKRATSSAWHHLCVSVCESCASGTSVRLDSWSVRCLPLALHCSSWQTVIDLEWSWK